MRTCEMGYGTTQASMEHPTSKAPTDTRTSGILVTNA